MSTSNSTDVDAKTADSHTEKANNVRAIRAIFAQLVAAWNRGDGSGYGTFFTEDADYIDVTGTHTQGNEAIGRLHQFLFDGPLKGSTLGYNSDNTQMDMKIDFLAPNIAIVIAGGASKLQGQSEAPVDRQSINTNILVRVNGEWKIRAFQNNRIQILPFGPPASKIET